MWGYTQNFFKNLSVKKNWKSVYISWSYNQKSSVLSLFETKYICIIVFHGKVQLCKTYVDVGSRATDGGKWRHCTSSAVVFWLSRPECFESTTMTLSCLLTYNILHRHRSYDVQCYLLRTGVQLLDCRYILVIKCSTFQIYLITYPNGHGSRGRWRAFSLFSTMYTFCC